MGKKKIQQLQVSVHFFKILMTEASTSLHFLLVLLIVYHFFQNRNFEV